MYQLFRQPGIKKFLLIETIPFAMSMFITETFLKLGSFTMECIAFLSGWYLLGWLANAALPKAGKN